MSSVTLYYLASAMLVIFSFPVPSLAEQAKARKRQNQKERKMIKELEAAISDRDSLKKSHQVLGEEMEKVKAQLAVTQNRWVLYGDQSLLYLYSVHFGSVVQTGSGIVSNSYILYKKVDTCEKHVYITLVQ